MNIAKLWALAVADRFGPSNGADGATFSKGSRGSCGVTLLELMTVLAIIAIAAGIAVPNLISWRKNLQLRSETDRLFRLVYHARARAAKERRTVVVAFDTDRNAFSAFVDDGTGGGTAGDERCNGAERVLQRGTLTDSVNMYKASFSGGVPRLTFNPMGLPNRFGSVRIRNASRTLYRQISISRSGFTRVKTSEDGIHWKG
jgi:prepilin-type N-terminal cleavage/methylation domain-containing protein